MKNIDHEIRQTLSAEDAAFLAKLDAQSPFQEALGTFSGTWGLMNVFAAVLTFAMFGVAAYCAWNAFNVMDVRETVLWSAGALVGMLSVAMFKIYFWMEMNKNITLRELKRLELQVTLMASRKEP